MKKSIIPGDDEYCYLCKQVHLMNRGTDVHHCLFGNKRKLADQDGLTVHLCHDHHMRLHQQGQHKDELICLAQITWMEHFDKTKEEFIARYGKSYI